MARYRIDNFLFRWMISNYMFCFLNIESTYQPSGYLGCYFDIQSSRFEALPYILYVSKSNNGDDCKYYCYLQNFKYSGTKKASCFCGNAVASIIVKNCNSPCPGKQEETCGGRFGMSIYSTQEKSNQTSILVPETTNISRSTTEASNLFTQTSTHSSTGTTHKSMDIVIIGVPVVCFVAVLSFVAVFILFRRRQQKQARNKLENQSTEGSQVSVVPATIMSFNNSDTDTFDIHSCCASGSVMTPNYIEYTEYSTTNEYSVCDSEDEYSEINAENISLTKEHVYGHTLHNNMQFVDQTYAHLSNEGKALRTADQYSYFCATQNVEHKPANDATYNHLQAFTNNSAFSISNTEDDLPYDISHAGEHNVEKEKIGEYSKLKY